LPTASFDTLLTLKQALEAPSRYLDSLPAKGIRDKATDALNIWFKVSATVATGIKQAVNLLHGASLMVDDIEDSSQLRRGKPAAHIVFGTVQTINASGYRFVSALAEVRKLDSEPCMDIFCGECRFV
jgi:fusicocca-2,10(14)-diene synthase/ophiobolin F synthase